MTIEPPARPLTPRILVVSWVLALAHAAGAGVLAQAYLGELVACAAFKTKRDWS